MPHCAVLGTNNVLQVTQDAVTACQGLIVLTPEDYQRLNAFSSFYVSLTLEEANQLLVAILGLWVVAYVYRQIYRLIVSKGENQNDEI